MKLNIYETLVFSKTFRYIENRRHYGMNVYEYLDYRSLIQHLCDQRRNDAPPAKLEVIAAQAGYRSAAGFSRMLNGQTKLSLKAAGRLARFFALTKSQAAYLEALMAYNHAESWEQKKRSFELLIALRSGKARTLTEQQYNLFSRWYYVAIRELLDFTIITDNYAKLGRMLTPPISANQTREAVKALEELGLVRRGPDGVLSRTESVVSTGEQWKSLAIREFQAETGRLGIEALNGIPPEKREIATLTLSISKRSFHAIRDRLLAIRKDLLEIARNDPNADRVYQVNFQFFPLTADKPQGEDA